MIQGFNGKNILSHIDTEEMCQKETKQSDSIDDYIEVTVKT